MHNVDMEVTQGECLRCAGKDEFHGEGCLVRRFIFKEQRLRPIPHNLAMEAAIRAMEEGNMDTKLAVQEKKFNIGQLESVFIKGDINAMTEIQRIEYVRELCRSLGLNPMTQPFDYIPFQGGKVVLYAKKSCTDQLRANYGISIKIISQTIEDGILTVVAQARFPEGREDEDIGCVSVGSHKGDALANLKMKAITKAKRRVTLSICGLGMLDESELETIPGRKIEKEVHSQPDKVAQLSQDKPLNAISTFKKPPEPLASEQEIKEMFAYAKSFGFTDVAPITDYIRRECGKEKVKNLSVSELLIVRDAIRDGDIKPAKASIIKSKAVESSLESNAIPEEDLPWNNEEQTSLMR